MEKQATAQRILVVGSGATRQLLVVIRGIGEDT